MAFDVGKILIDWFEAREEAVLEHVLVIIENPGNPTQKHEEINQPKIKTKINILIRLIWTWFNIKMYAVNPPPH